MSNVFKIQDSNSIVRVKNVMGAGHIAIMDGDKSVIITSGQVAEITWKAWVNCQKDRKLQRWLKLDESVHITEDGEVILYGVKLADGEELLSHEDMFNYFALPAAVFSTHVEQLGIANLKRLLEEAATRSRDDFIKIIEARIIRLEGEISSIDVETGEEYDT